AHDEERGAEFEPGQDREQPGRAVNQARAVVVSHSRRDREAVRRLDPIMFLDVEAQDNARPELAVRRQQRPLYPCDFDQVVGRTHESVSVLVSAGSLSSLMITSESKADPPEA